MTADDSKRLTILRFPLILAVLFIHSLIGESSTIHKEILQGSFTAPFFICQYFSNGICSIAVPLFAMIAGFLFFKEKTLSLPLYKKKLHSRLISLAVPFVLWNGGYFLFLWIMSALPQTKTFFTGDAAWVFKDTPIAQINTILGFMGSPILYQFWFIRDLIYAVLLTPLVYVLLRKPSLAIISIGAFSAIHIFAPIGDTLRVYFYFTIGCAIAIHGKSLFDLDRFGSAFLFIFIVGSLLLTIPHLPHYVEIKNLNTLLGVPAGLFLTKFIIKSIRVTQALVLLSYSSFFIFSIHTPLMTIVRKVLYKLTDVTQEYVVIGIYLITPVIVAFISYLIFITMRKYSPKFTGILTGGR